MFGFFNKKKKGLSKLLNAVLLPQKLELESQGETIFVNEVTYAYLSTYLSIIRDGKGFKVEEILNLLSDALDGEQTQFLIRNGYDTFMNMSSSSLKQIFDELESIIPAEFSSGHCDFLVRYTRYAWKDISETLENPNFDPSKYVRTPLTEI